MKPVAREPLVMVGVDYRVASTRYRAALAMDEAARLKLMGTLREHGAEGLVIIETCNRTEWLVAGPRGGWIAQLLSAHMWTMWEAAGLPQPFPKPLVAEGPAVVRHLFRMAAGLESFVRGERQIAGQLQRAFHSARLAHHSCGLLNVLGSWAGRVVRKAKRSGASVSAAAGVHLLAVERIEAVLGPRRRVAVVGMGEIGQRCRTLLRQHGHQVVCYNRSPGPEWRSLETLIADAPQRDAVVVATGAPSAWLEAERLVAAAPLLLIDIGSPAQVEACDELGVLGLDELLRGQRPEDPRMVEALEDQVEQSVLEFSLSQTRRGLRHVVEHNHRTYERLAYSVLPTLLSDADDGGQSVEQIMRDLLREYSREVIRSVEDGARL